MLLTVEEQIETDTHPQQESVTSSRRHTHTHTLCVGWLRPQQMLYMNILAKLSGRVSIFMDQM